jgi:hypothetical protein
MLLALSIAYPIVAFGNLSELWPSIRLSNRNRSYLRSLPVVVAAGHGFVTPTRHRLLAQLRVYGQFYLHAHVYMSTYMHV